MRVLVVAPLDGSSRGVIEGALASVDCQRRWLPGIHAMYERKVERFDPDVGIGVLGTTRALVNQLRDLGICAEEKGFVTVPVIMMYDADCDSAVSLAQQYLLGGLGQGEKEGCLGIAEVATDLGSLQAALARLLE